MVLCACVDHEFCFSKESKFCIVLRLSLTVLLQQLQSFQQCYYSAMLLHARENILDLAIIKIYITFLLGPQSKITEAKYNLS